jgi:hypothetical protein
VEFRRRTRHLRFALLAGAQRSVRCPLARQVATDLDASHGPRMLRATGRYWDGWFPAAMTFRPKDCADGLERSWLQLRTLGATPCPSPQWLVFRHDWSQPRRSR